MNDSEPQGHPAPNFGNGHEPTEIGVRAILIFGAALVVISAGAMILLAGLMRSFATEEKAGGTTAEEISADRPGDFPAPRLQHHTTEDMKEYRAREDASLKSYGWVDRKAGIAQIPMDEAMKLLAEKGLPRVKAPEPPKPAAESKPAASEPARKE
jgi:hypothetical protein